MRMLLLSPPKGGSKSEFVVVVNKIQFLQNEVCYKVSLRESFQRQSCSIIIPLSMVHFGGKRNPTTFSLKVTKRRLEDTSAHSSSAVR